MLRAVAANGGVVMINFGSTFISQTSIEWRAKYKKAESKYREANKDAKDKARVYFSELIEAGEKPSEKKAKEMLLEKIVESYDIEEVLTGESAGSDKVGKNVLIKIPADMTIQKIKLYESHGVISDSGKYIKTIQNRK